MAAQMAEQHLCATSLCSILLHALTCFIWVMASKLTWTVCFVIIGAHGRPPPPFPSSCLHLERSFLEQNPLQHHWDVLCAGQVELISWKSIKDIAGDGGVIKTVETEGKGWEKPSDKDEALGTCAQAACRLRITWS